MKIKSLLVAIGASAMLSGCAITSNIKEPINELNVVEVKRENDSTTTSEEATSDYLADEDNNGIPDIWEKEFEDSKLASILGGVSLSALITLILNLIYYVVRFFLDKHANTNATKLLKKTTESQNKYFDENKSIRDELDNANKSYKESLNNSINELKEITSKYDELLQENVKLKECINEIQMKQKTILENQVILSQTTENVKSGRASQVAENVKREIQ